MTAGLPTTASLGVVAGSVILGVLAGSAAPVLARRFVPVTGVHDPLGQAGVPPRFAGCFVLPTGAHRLPMSPAAVPRWPVPALAGAVVFAGLAVARGDDPALPVFLLVAAIGLVLAVVDLICLRLPDLLVAAAAGGGILGLGVVALATGTPARFPMMAAGTAVSLAVYLTLAVLPRSRLGFGDVKLAAALGPALGWAGWSALGWGLALPHVLAGVTALVLLATHRVRPDTPLPFGPAILCATWLALLA
ncbi:A24 family peptidase [Micromonospora globbae]|uniref:A24 family peptidase n=1 Tax=Micromonospora globbae TaxID=1894969 RepID=UPI00341F4DFB